ncbi:ABC transporter ATP-binding protein [Prosthecodimorpha staleyi]|uniref:ABC transporter ATP-binding protein n=1 Tax=Prosthecodimorpha staleyi TaxID=2840188 RepID=UPI0021C3FEBF|nr:ABC transporter ATP-binding protein [Prosthecodimorpha staleyi]
MIETAGRTAGAAVPAIEVAHVSHAFGARKALDDVSLGVPQGAFVALLGLNGAGKTTLFSLLTRLYDNVTGRIAIMGSDLRRRPTEALGRLGVVFQARTLDPDLTVLQNFTYHASLHGLSRAEGRRRAERLLARISLADRLNDKVRSLSGGQARRVEIARALLHDPRVVILDEPTVGLDIAARQDIVSLVRRLVDEDGLSVLWATHLFDEVRPADPIVLLHKGRVLARGTTPELCAQAGEPGLAGAFRKITGTPTEEAA